MSVWQVKQRPTGSSLAVCNLAEGVDNFSFQRIIAFQDEMGPPSAGMTHRFHLQCQLLWIVGDFLEGHVKGILGLRPGSVGKRWMADYRGLPKEGRMSRRMAGAGEKNGGEKKKADPDPKSPSISFYRWWNQVPENMPEALQTHGPRKETWTPISQVPFISILLPPAVV